MTHAPHSLATDLAARCRAIELLVLDVDGVLTDGVIALDDHGVETKHFYVRDGSGLALWRLSGKKAAILSGRRAKCVELRATELGISPVIQGASRKLEPFRALIGGFGLESHQVAYMGDDLVDLSVLAEAGLAACPSDAAEEVRAIAHMIASQPGGRGAVREVIELILQNQGTWEGLVAGLRNA